MTDFISTQEPWRLPSRQAEFNGTDRLRLDAHSDYHALWYVKAWVQNLMKTGMQNNVFMHFDLLFLGRLNEI